MGPGNKCLFSERPQMIIRRRTFIVKRLSKSGITPIIELNIRLMLATKHSSGRLAKPIDIEFPRKWTVELGGVQWWTRRLLLPIGRLHCAVRSMFELEGINGCSKVDVSGSFVRWRTRMTRVRDE